MFFGTLLVCLLLAVNTANGGINGWEYIAGMGSHFVDAPKIDEATWNMDIKHVGTGLKYTAEIVKRIFEAIVQATISAAAPTAKRIGEATVDFASKPEVQSAASTALKAAACALLAIGVATLALPVVGFTALGVTKGSLAAFAHSAIGNVAAGSIFSIFQSAGVLGPAVYIKLGIGSIGAYFGSKL